MTLIITVPKPVKNDESSDKEDESDGDKGAFKLTKAERRAKLKKKKKEEVPTRRRRLIHCHTANRVDGHFELEHGGCRVERRIARVLCGERLGRMLPHFVSSQSAALFKLSALAA